MSYFYSLRAAKEPPWRLAHGIWSAVQQLDLDTTQPKEFTLNTLASMLINLRVLTLVSMTTPLPRSVAKKAHRDQLTAKKWTTAKADNPILRDLSFKFKAERNDLTVKVWDGDELINPGMPVKLTHARDFYFTVSLPGSEPGKEHAYNFDMTLHRKGEFFTGIVKYPEGDSHRDAVGISGAGDFYMS